jgi:hypothetical protein
MSLNSVNAGRKHRPTRAIKVIIIIISVITVYVTALLSPPPSLNHDDDAVLSTVVVVVLGPLITPEIFSCAGKKCGFNSLAFLHRFVGDLNKQKLNARC